MNKLVLTVLLHLIGMILICAQSQGSIKGRLIDADTKSPLISANILILNKLTGTTTDLDGNFTLSGLPAGSYSIKFSYIGYEALIKPDVIVKPSRMTFLDIELFPATMSTDSVVVTAGYFRNRDIQMNSITSFAYEEIRRAPGSGGDVSRIMMGLPSVAKVNDQSNSLIVRGGSPIENSFYIDNIEIPNINHFPMVGSSGGPIGLINVDFIDNVDFYSGGFNSVYGGKLSSIMDISFRDGNREKFEAQLDLSFQAVGGIVEGPIYSGKGSWFLAARKSYLDIIFESVAPGEAMPDYSDFHAKVSYDLFRDHKLSFLNIYSRDRQTMTYSKAFENKKSDYFDINVDMNTSGINWQYIWGNSGYSETTLSYLYWRDNRIFTDTKTRSKTNNLNTLEQALRLRNTNHYKISNNNKIDFGMDFKFTFNDYDNFYSESVNPAGEQVSPLYADGDIRYFESALFANYYWDASSSLLVNPGVRMAYSGYNRQVEISPRLSATYKFNELTSLSASYGIYYQPVPAIFLAQNSGFKNLKNPRAAHFVISFNHLLNEDIKLTIELYSKEYSKLPVDPAFPQVLTYDQSLFESVNDSHEILISKGTAFSRGIELSVQKKLAESFTDLYQLHISDRDTKILTGPGGTRIFDNKYSLTLEGGYKLNEMWEFSSRWIYAGGVPYTPFDLDASQVVNSGIYNLNSINGVRLPDYHSLNLRVDKRFYFRNSSLVIYISVWNAYGRKNLYAYSWNEFTNKPQEEKQWTTIPIFGLEYEF